MAFVAECNETDVKLVDGVSTEDGRVVICFNGLWGSVCHNNWDDHDAEVVCKQLGYNGSKYPSVGRRCMHYDTGQSSRDPRRLKIG